LADFGRSSSADWKNFVLAVPDFYG